jgi:hypothetical protein
MYKISRDAMQYAIYVHVMLLTLTLSGCGESVESGNNGNVKKACCRTIEELIDRYNALTYDRETVDIESKLELYYAENEVQEQLIRIQHASIPYYEFRHAVYKAYGEHSGSGDALPLIFPNLSKAEVVECGEDRALARVSAANGKASDIHIVRIGETWMISGYTLEYDMGGVDASELGNLEHVARLASSVSQEIVRMIRNGEVSSAAEANDAFENAVRQTMREE